MDPMLEYKKCLNKTKRSETIKIIFACNGIKFLIDCRNLSAKFPQRRTLINILISNHKSRGSHKSIRKYPELNKNKNISCQNS